MAVLKSRANAALAGAFGGAGDFLAQWMKQKQAENMQQRQNEFITGRERQNKLEGDADKGAADVRSGATTLDQYGENLIPLLKMRLGNYTGPSQQDRLDKVLPGIKGDTTDSQLLAELRNKGVSTASSNGQTAQFAGDEDTLPSTQFGDTAGPNVGQALAARSQDLDATKAKDAREVNQTYEKGYATDSAKAAVTDAHAGQVRDDAVETETAMGPAKAKSAGLVAGATEDAKNDPVRQAAAARGAAKTAGAVSDAEQPNKERLAKIHADYQLINQQALDNYKKSHPAMPAEQLNKHANATAAITLVDSEISPLLDEMSKRGMLGALKGRAEDFASGKLKTTDVFKSPEDAQLAARFFDSAKLLSSLIAKTHGGARAISSTGTQQYFSNIFNGIGDEPIVRGQLGSVYKLMQIYQDKPDTPEGFPIPGFTFKDAGTVPGPGMPLSSNLEQRLQR